MNIKELDCHIKIFRKESYNMDWHEFHNKYNDLHFELISMYFDGVISNQLKMYFKRRLWSIKNRYKLDNDLDCYYYRHTRYHFY